MVNADHSYDTWKRTLVSKNFWYQFYTIYGFQEVYDLYNLKIILYEFEIYNPNKEYFRRKKK